MKRSKPPSQGPREGAALHARHRVRAAASPPGRPLPWLAPAAILILVVVLGADVFRIGFFADDFHFLDVARRVPLLRAIGGQFGVYPWYRPLSRELYFALVAATGPAALATAHALSLACLGVSAWLIRRLALGLADPRAAAVAPVLFLTYGITKFLAAWASGFQDLLAVLLVLLAVVAQAEGRPLRSAAWAFLAPLAKETGLVVFAIVALHAVLVQRERRFRPWMLAHAGALAAVVAIHVAVRATWHTGGTEAHVQRSLPALLLALARVAGGFAGGKAVLDPAALGLALAATLAAAMLLAPASAPVPPAARPAEATPGAGRPRAVLFLAAAAALGLAPLVAVNAFALGSAYEYYGFPAVPWLALLLSLAITRLPRAACAIAVAALAGWNTLALGYRAPDLSAPEAWAFRNWDWPEAVRLSAISRRLADDVRAHFATRPESLVVLYSDIRTGSFFQTEDGPATREALRDPTVRAYWINAPPYGLAAGRIAILSFNFGRGHLERYVVGNDQRGALTATAVAQGDAPAAWMFASLGDSSGNALFPFAYFRSASALMVEGVAGARRELAALGLADTTGPAPERWANAMAGSESPLHAPLLNALRHPLDAGAHVALADAMRARGARVSEAVELRIATTLEPRRAAERLRLARTLTDLGLAAAARRDLARLVAFSPGTPEAAEAVRLLEVAVESAPPAETEASIREFTPR